MPPTKKVGGNRAEIAGRAHLKCFRESNCQLAREYGVSEHAVRDIIIEYKDKMDEATAAAIMYYQDHPRPVQPAASNQAAAQQLQSAFAHNFAGSRHATHPAATGSVSAAAGTMPTAMPGRLDPALLHHDLEFFSMVAHLMQPRFGSSNPLIPIQVSNACGQAGPGDSLGGAPAVAISSQPTTVAFSAQVVQQQVTPNPASALLDEPVSDIEQRIRQRVRSSIDCNRISERVRAECLKSIGDCHRVGRQLFHSQGWPKYDIDVLLLDDQEWQKTHWIEFFIDAHLKDLDAKLIDLFRQIIGEQCIQSETDLRTRHSQIKFPLLVTSVLETLFTPLPGADVQIETNSDQHRSRLAGGGREGAARDGVCSQDDLSPQSPMDTGTEMNLPEAETILQEDVNNRIAEQQVQEGPDTSNENNEKSPSKRHRLESPKAASMLIPSAMDQDMANAQNCQVSKDLHGKVPNNAVLPHDMAGGNQESERPPDAASSLAVESGGTGESPFANADIAAVKVSTGSQASSVSLAILYKNYKSRLDKIHRNIPDTVIETVESIFHRNIPSSGELKFQKIAGAGSYGVVVQACVAKQTPVAFKIEFVYSRDESALKRELGVFQRRLRGQNSPFPQLVQVFANTKKEKASCSSIMVVFGGLSVLTMAIEYLDAWPQKVLADATKLYRKEKRVDDTTHELILQIMDSLLFLQSYRLAHLDIKHAHLYGRTNGSFVLVDWGLSRFVNQTYMPQARKRARQQQLDQLDLSADPVVTLPVPCADQSPSLVLGEESDGRPGTLVYRVPVPCATGDDLLMADAHAFGAILLTVPWEWRHQPEWRSTEKEVYALARGDYKDFENKLLLKLDKQASSDSRAAVSRRARAVHDTHHPVPAVFDDAFGKDILRLIYHLLRPDPKLRWDPIQMLSSAFARKHIPPLSLYHQLRFEGVRFPSKHLGGGRTQNPRLLLWIEGRGLETFNLLNDRAGDQTTSYGGLLQTLNTTKTPTCANDLSLHSIVVSASEVLNGTPCKDNPLQNFIDRGASGSFMRSSRKNPGTARAGNHSRPDRLGFRTNEQLVNGQTFSQVSMFARKDSMWGTEGSFCYDYTNAVLQCLTEEEQEQIVSPYSQRLPFEVYRILREQREEVLKQGFKDSEPKSRPCSITFCGCGDKNVNECDMFWLTEEDVDSCLRAYPNLGNPKTEQQYWEMPGTISVDKLERITVSKFFFNEGGSNNTAEQEKVVSLVRKNLETESCALLKAYFISHPNGTALLAGAKEVLAKTKFRECVHLNVAEGRRIINKGDESKMIAYFQDPAHPVAQLLAAVTDEIFPGFNVAVSKDRHGGDFREVAALNQMPTRNGEQLKKNMISRSVHQIVHVDTPPLSAKFGDEGALNVHRASLKQYVDGQGPVSIWVPLPEAGQTMTMVIYLGSSIRAVKLLAHCAKHFRSMQEAYFRVWPSASEDEFLKVWIGAGVLLMRNDKDQFEPTEAAAIACQLGDALAMHGVSSHGGTDEFGFRAFTSISKKVRDFICIR